MSWKKPTIYFTKIIVILGLIMVTLHTALVAIGERANPPKLDIENYSTPKIVNVYKKKDWAFSDRGPFLLFSSDKWNETKGQNVNLESDSILFLIQKDLTKELAIEFIDQIKLPNLKRVFIASPYDSTLRMLREVEPRFYYSPSPQELLKWNLFAGFGLQNVYPIKGDFIFLDNKGQEILNPKLKKEIQRRNLKVILNPKMN